MAIRPPEFDFEIATKFHYRCNTIQKNKTLVGVAAIAAAVLGMGACFASFLFPNMTSPLAFHATLYSGVALGGIHVIFHLRLMRMNRYQRKIEQWLDDIGYYTTIEAMLYRKALLEELTADLEPGPYELIPDDMRKPDEAIEALLNGESFNEDLDRVEIEFDSHNQSCDEYLASPIPSEGSRSVVDRWKSRFQA